MKAIARRRFGKHAKHCSRLVLQPQTRLGLAWFAFEAGRVYFGGWLVWIACGPTWFTFGDGLLYFWAGLVDFGAGLVYIGAALVYVWAGLVYFAGHAMRLGLVVLLGFVKGSLGAPHQSSQTYPLLRGTPNPTLLLL